MPKWRIWEESCNAVRKPLAVLKRTLHVKDIGSLWLSHLSGQLQSSGLLPGTVERKLVALMVMMEKIIEDHVRPKSS